MQSHRQLSYQKGQILLLIILIGAIALTIGLSVASRTINNIRTANEEEMSQRALSAAEAGIQRVLNGQVTNDVPFSANQARVTATSLAVGGSSQPVVVHNDNLILANQGVDLWLINHKSDGTLDFGAPAWNGSLKIAWDRNPASCTTLELIAITTSGSANGPYIVTHYIADPCTRGSNFPSQNLPANGGPFSTTINSSNVTYQHSTNPASPLTITNGIVLHIIPLFANTQIWIEPQGGVALPQQGQTITALGSAGDTQRKILYYQGYAALPTELFYTIYDKSN